MGRGERWGKTGNNGSCQGERMEGERRMTNARGKETGRQDRRRTWEGEKQDDNKK